MLTGTDLAFNSSEIHFEYLRKHEECLIYVANKVCFLGVVLMSATNYVLLTAELFNAIFHLARSVLVVIEIKGCCFTACFYLMDQSGE